MFPGFLTPVLTQLFSPKPPATFLTCFCRGERQKYAGKKSRVNRGSNSQPPGHESDTLTTEPPGWGENIAGKGENTGQHFLLFPKKHLLQGLENTGLFGNRDDDRKVLSYKNNFPQEVQKCITKSHAAENPRLILEFQSYNYQTKCIDFSPNILIKSGCHWRQENLILGCDINSSYLQLKTQSQGPY